MQIQPDNILKGSFWPEKVRVISVKNISENRFRIEAVGLETQRFYNPILSYEDIESVEIAEEKPFLFSADGESLFLYLESHRIRNAFQFDPLYAVNVSQIDPLPHQIEAVYHYIIQNPRIRFLLADDPGAGKTIMAGLLLKELKYRGLIERTLIVAPGHLKDQWLREMKEKFQESFIIVDRGSINSSWGQNIFTDRNQIIISMDFAKQEDVMFALNDSKWDMVIIDEAHKMSAYKYGEKIDKTQRYFLGELLSSITNYLLFLTATPHRGDPENFRLLLDLLEPDFFANTEMLNESIQNKDNPLFLRRLKEDLKGFDNAPLFPPRKVETPKYYLSDEEKTLYNEVTEYVQNHFNKALEKEKRNVTFALTILQRRLASSTRAIRKSLERRYERLKELYEKGQLLVKEVSYEEEYVEDLEEKERWEKEEELLEKLSSAETLDELNEEIEKLERLVNLARDVEKRGVETKLNELKKVIESEKLWESQTKLLIFTESRDTLDYLVENLKKWGYSVTFIHGGMSLDDRIKAEANFRNQSQIMVSTEAGGEGINLQFCWLMVNYDIPWNPNRLEQRMGRIHRYGQQHEVHIYNLVTIDTREGQILNKLFEKLSNIREHLGSDRVFDVIGEVLTGKSLKDLIVDAIANRRTMDEILKDFERIPDETAIEKVKEASLEALATRHIDLTRILGEQRRAKENRLVPEYVEEFFKRASSKLNIKMERRQGLFAQKGETFWRISHVPLAIRNQPYDFKIRFGEVNTEYSKISFDKERAFKAQAEFVAMGHPLLEAVIETILKDYANDASSGATFIDPEGRKDGIIWFVETEIKDGKNETAGRKLFAIFQDKDNSLSFINPAILWDLKPQTHQLTDTTPPLDKDAVISFVITQGLENYKKELLERRQRDAQIKEKYGIRSLDSMILLSDAKISDYETRRMKNENVPEAIIQNEMRKKEDLERKKERLKKEISAEVHLYPTDPKILGAIRVLPQKSDDKSLEQAEMIPDEEIELIGIKTVIEYEINNGRTPEDVSSQNLGYDICSSDKDGNYRYIEVKSRAKEGAIALTPNEWFMAQRLKEEYWLYIVANAVINPELYIIQYPALHLKPEEEMSIVRYIIKDWKERSNKEGQI